MSDLDGRAPSSRTRRVREELSLNTPVHRAEEERSTVHRLRDGQVSVVLQDHAFCAPQCLSDVSTLVFLEHDPAEARVHTMVVVEPVIIVRIQHFYIFVWGLMFEMWGGNSLDSNVGKRDQDKNRWTDGQTDIPARILVDGFKFTSNRRECLAGDAVAMDRSNNVWTSFVHRCVDDVSRRVDRVHVPALFDFSILADQHEIFGSHVAERLAMRVDPEVVGHDGVADRDVSACALVVVPLEPEPSQGGGVMEFAERALGFEGLELGDADAMDGFGVGASDFHVRAICELRRWRRWVAGDGAGCHRRWSCF